MITILISIRWRMRASLQRAASMATVVVSSIVILAGRGADAARLTGSTGTDRIFWALSERLQRFAVGRSANHYCDDPDYAHPQSGPALLHRSRRRRRRRAAVRRAAQPA